MAIIPISDLEELITPASGDELVIVDASEPLDIDKTKKISFLNLVTNAITAAFAAYVPTLIYKRQGGSSTDWSATGTTNYTPGTSTKIQAGICDVVIGSGSDDGSTTVTFPAAFSKKPIIFTDLETLADGVYTFGYAWDTTTCRVGARSETRNRTLKVKWLAIGE
jgi:hypothetical protein